MAITGISSYDGKQIIAAGAQSATKAYQDSNGDVITSKYQTTANMSNYQTTAGMSDYATTASVTGKQDTLTFGYTDDQISQINGSGIYSQGGGGGGVVTATGGTTDYVQTINGKNISATNAGSALSATDAYNLTNTAIKVASATSASTAYTLGNTAIKVASATSATNANTATWASNGALLTDIYNSAGSGYRAFTALTGTSGYAHYYQGGMANWWNSTASNPLCIKINTANFCTAGSVTDAHLFLKQLSGPESAYTATMLISNYKTSTQWAAKEIATFGGGVHDQSNTVNPQYLLWNSNIVFNAQHGGWNQSITGIFLGGSWTSSGQDLMLNITGIVSK